MIPKKTITRQDYPVGAGSFCSAVARLSSHLNPEVSICESLMGNSNSGATGFGALLGGAFGGWLAWVGISFGALEGTAGAAAFSSGLAWMGGGSLAAGGLGMFGGLVACGLLVGAGAVMGAVAVSSLFSSRWRS